MNVAIEAFVWYEVTHDIFVYFPFNLQPIFI
jgi:hypothetical protein